VGVRIPKHPVALGLTAALGHPIISSTAARPGADPDPDPREIELAFPGLGLVLDAGAGGTVPTTVVDLTGSEPVIVRRGAGDTEPFEQ
jgi:tRNA A37 threonylcarbamoyladenosine synthetase subunit TsaC/SUA5/YrdC